jgi:hypothetical protein
MKTLIDYLPKFVDALKIQLEDDEKRWKNTWTTRTIDGQEERIFAKYRDYYDQWKNAGVPIPWLKIAGEALIAWVRENNHEYWKE